MLRPLSGPDFDVWQQAAALVLSKRPDLAAEIAHITRRLNPLQASNDFACVRMGDQLFSFTPMQGAIVRRLWVAMEEGLPEVRQETLLADAGCNSDRISDVFGKDHPAWGTLIVQGKAKGTFRISGPPATRAGTSGDVG